MTARGLSAKESTEGSVTTSNRKVLSRVSNSSVDSFARELNRYLGKISDDKTTSEEELFAAVVEQRVRNTLPETSNLYYQNARQTYAADAARNNSKPSQERIAKQTLRYLESVGQLTQSERLSLQQLASEVSQLDQKSPLWDQYGTGKDRTVAALDQKKAVKLASLRLVALATS